MCHIGEKPVTNFFFRVWKALSHSADHQNPSVDFAVRQCKGEAISAKSSRNLQPDPGSFLHRTPWKGRATALLLLSCLDWYLLLLLRPQVPFKNYHIVQVDEPRLPLQASKDKLHKSLEWPGALQRPNGITWNSKRPWRVANAVL